MVTDSEPLTPQAASLEAGIPRTGSPETGSPETKSPETKNLVGRRRRRFVFLAVVLLVLAGYPFLLRGNTGEVAVRTTSGVAASPPEDADDTLRIMTLNVAHGRGTGSHQFLLDQEEIQANLDGIARLVRAASADVVALQEADGASWWSGGFDHVDRIARESGLRFHARGAHVDSFGLSYGTAILSRLPLEAAVSRTFTPTPPTPPKGIVQSSFRWPGRPELAPVRVVSVHLDFLLSRSRRAQARELVVELRTAESPLIVMGDFNAESTDASEALGLLCAELELRVFQSARASAGELVTFPQRGFAGGGRRLDWILVSADLEFVGYEVLPDRVSDHLAVVAQVRLRPAR